MTERTFTQGDYTDIVRGLDDVMTVLLSFGKTEAEAQEWLLAFITKHYLPVWRKINS